MPDFEKLYYTMFNAMTDIEIKLQEVIKLLRAAQIECEAIYLEGDEQNEGVSPNHAK